MIAFDDLGSQADASDIDLFLRDEVETTAFGAWLAGRLSAGDVVYLLGDLGAGKSTLARGLIRALTHPEEEVPSPTFTLLQTYEGPEVDIAHFDLYRLTDPEEVYEIGLFELKNTHLCLIEWPQRLAHLGFDAPWYVRLQDHISDKGEHGRRVQLKRPLNAEPPNAENDTHD